MRGAGVACLGLAFLAVLAACGGGGDTPPPADPEQVLRQAAERLKDVKSFRFSLGHENGTTAMPLNLDLVSAEGDVAVPDRLAADVVAKASGVTVRVKVIAVADRTWITNPFSRQWQRLPGEVSVRDIADPAAFVMAVVGAMRDIELVGSERLDGVATYKVSGSVDSGALRSALGSAQPGLSVAVEVWAGVDDGLPRRVRLRGGVSPDEPGDIVRTLSLSGFDAPVKIEPPE